MRTAPRSSQIYPYLSYGKPRLVPSSEVATTGSVAAETAARIAADNTLQTNINNEAATRAAADTTLQNNINLKANIASPTFTGDPRAPTPAPGDSDTSVATTAFVTAAISSASGAYVAKAGDTMTGQLIMSGASSGFQLLDRDLGGSYAYWYRQSGITRWLESALGTDVLVFNNTGNVGIGTASLNSKFTVHAGANQNGIIGLNGGLTTIGALNDAGNAWVPLQINPNGPVYIAAAGPSNVGIGTISPAAKLHVSAADGGLIGFIAGASAGIRFGAAGANAYLTGIDNTGTGAYQPLHIQGSLMTFDPGGTERVRIDSSGNVGIGTTSPVAALDVANGGVITVQSGGGILGNIYYSGGWKFKGATGFGATWIFSGTDPALQLYVATGNTGANSTATLINPMSITSTGNIGIGTTAPGGKLQVNAASGSSQPLQLSTNDFVSTSTGSSLVFGFGASSGNTYSTIQALSGGNFAYNHLILQATGTGNVGIGTTTPGTSKLLVKVGTNQNISTQVHGGFSTIGALNDAASGWVPLKINPGTDTYICDGGGNVGIGTTAVAARLHVVGTAAAGNLTMRVASGPNGTDTTTYYQQFTDYAGAVQTGLIARNGSNTVAFVTTSDQRLKDDIRQSERGLDALMQIKVSDYRMGETESQGLIAQDLHDIYPEAVFVGGDDPNLEPWGVDYGRITPLLIRTIQQLVARLAVLEARDGR